MIDLKRVFDNAMICESGCRCLHIFNDGSITFADIRDIVKKIFGGELTMSEKISGLPLMVTFKDGKFKVAVDAKKIDDPVDISTADDTCWAGPVEVKTAFSNSLKDLCAALAKLDPVQLNKYFANGQNFMHCKVLFPPANNPIDYGDRCLIVLDNVICYNNKFKQVGEDKKTADELFAMLQQNDALHQSTFDITKQNIMKIKNLTLTKEVALRVLDRLSAFIDGVGWKCSLSDYVRDRYARYLVNKALEHGLDVSRTSEFVSELASRLSNVSGRRPTKSDLATFAKREGLDCKCQQYKDFLNDIESNSDQTNADIIKPIEDLIVYIGIELMKNIDGYVALDPSKTAKKFQAQLDAAIEQVKNGQVELTPEKIERFKRDLARIEQYHEMMPAEGVLIRYKGKPYKLVGNFGPANQILDLIRYK